MTECDGYLDLMIMVSNAKIGSLSSLIEKMGFETFRFTLSSDKLGWCCLDLLRLKTGGPTWPRLGFVAAGRLKNLRSGKDTNRLQHGLLSIVQQCDSHSLSLT